MNTFAPLSDSDTVTVTVGRLREMIAYAAAEAPEYLSTVQASATFGWSRGYWAQKAAENAIQGAFQEGDRWRLPLVGVKKYVAQLQLRYRRSVLRGPRASRKAS